MRGESLNSKRIKRIRRLRNDFSVRYDSKFMKSLKRVSARPRRFFAGALILTGAVVLSGCLPPPPPPVGPGTIAGPSELNAAQIAAYVCSVKNCAPGSNVPPSWKPEITPEQMAQLYIDEGNAAGVRGDIAFVQSIWETGWFAWPNSPDPATVPVPAPGDNTWAGFVLARDHNYCGMGAYGGSTRFMRKDFPYQGVRAQIQHLRNYADAGSRSTNLGYPMEPRPYLTASSYDSFTYKGKAPLWVDLNGKWAVPGSTYGQNILRIYNGMRASVGLGPVTPTGDMGVASELDAWGSDLLDATARN